jgi:hypothetical protein
VWSTWRALPGHCLGTAACGWAALLWTLDEFLLVSAAQSLDALMLFIWHPAFDKIDVASNA